MTPKPVNPKPTADGPFRDTWRLSWLDACHYARTPVSSKYAAGEVSNPPAEWWDGGVGMDGTVTMLDRGNDDMTTRINAMAERIRTRIHETFDTAQGWAATPEGEQWRVDIGAAVTGDPEPYCIEVPSRPKTYTIGVNLTASSAVEAHILTNRAAAVLGLVKALQDMNHEVKTFAYIDVRGWTDKRRYLIEVAFSPEPALIACVGHPAFYRRAMFRVHGHYDEQRDTHIFGSPKGRCHTELTPGYSLPLPCLIQGETTAPWDTEKRAEDEAVRLFGILAEQDTVAT